jgi:hypothetical protein
MAKRSTRRTPAQPTSNFEAKVVDYAEELGRLIGTVRARVDGMGAERRKLVAQLSGVVKSAQSLLSELGHGGAKGASKRRGARTRRKGGKIPKHTAGGPDARTHRLPATAREKMARGGGRGKRRAT